MSIACDRLCTAAPMPLLTVLVGIHGLARKGCQGLI